VSTSNSLAENTYIGPLGVELQCEGKTKCDRFCEDVVSLLSYSSKRGDEATMARR
jgi:hypothetical protein